MSIRVFSLAIGDELLDGRVLDGNTRTLGDALSTIGLELCGARTVPDDEDTIVAAIKDAAAIADIVVTSGGLGPTSDDVTGLCVARAAGTGMRFDEDAFARMSALFAMRGIDMPPSNRRQAELPATSVTLENQMGTAPGFVTPMPSSAGAGAGAGGSPSEVWCFPGVPKEYQHLLTDYLLPALQGRISTSPTRRLVRRTLRCLGLAESAIGDRLQPFETAHPEVRVQYRAAFPEIIVRLVLDVDSKDVDDGDLRARADALTEEARAAIGRSVWGIGDAPLEERVLESLRRRGLTMGTAESCTGGLIAKRLTDVAGSSDVVAGGIVSYANAVKVKQLGVQQSTLDTDGAVSAATATQMAAGAKSALDVDVVIAVTGVAGPGGGSNEKPVGTVFFGLAGPWGVEAVHKKFPDFGRDRVRDMTAATALRMVLDAVDALPES